MKRNMISVALFAVLATMAVSCQKENFMEPQSSVMEVDSVRSVLYSVNGVEHSVTLYNDEEWDAFVDTMMSLARQGYDVRFVDQNAAAHSIATKIRRPTPHPTKLMQRLGRKKKQAKVILSARHTPMVSLLFMP